MTVIMAAMTDEDSKTVGSCLAGIRARLASAGIESGEQEAHWLIEHALGLSSLVQAIERDRALSRGEIEAVQTLVARRVSREPLQYLLGTQEFYGMEFVVTPAVLIPRPETELLVEQVVRRISLEQPANVVDVCTGSGCVAVAIARGRPRIQVMGTDISGPALAIAQENARRQAVADRITWLEGDLLKPLAGKNLEGSVDVIVSNPPYIQPEVKHFEPRQALVAGSRGTEYHERLLCEATRYLTPGGALMMEIGMGQGPAVRQLVEKVGGYESAQVLQDAAGIERVVIVERSNY
jgi:release factor glutamine methyltransferase